MATFKKDDKDLDWEKLLENLRKPVQRTIDRLLEKLYRGLEDESNDDYSVYTGIGGISLLHLHLYRVYGEDKGHLECALDCLKRPLRHLKGRRISFLCGDAGPLALAAVIYHKLGNSRASSDCIKKLESLHKPVWEDPSLPDELLYGRAGYLYALLFVNSNFGEERISRSVTEKVLESLHKPVCEDPSLPDELLYGRAGYLYALLFVNSHFGEERISRSVTEKMYKMIIDSGIHMSQQQGWHHPLMYAWHEKHYLGAAHGLAGILFLLMQVRDEKAQKYIDELVRPSVEYMLTLRFPSGNCPSSIGSSTGDKLIHWCHGAPGWVHMFIMAYKLFKEDRYLQAAKDCGEVIWSRGLLTKGYGICHGVAGNAYAFLALYQLTDDQKHLYRAYKFAEWCFDYGRHGCRRPDRPYSLFEGLAGTVYFLTDLLDPKNAKFPAFYLP